MSSQIKIVHFMDELEKLKEENRRLKEELERIRSKCRHPKSFIIRKIDSADSNNSVVYHCPDCGAEFEGTD